MTPRDPSVDALRRLGDFALAQVFRPHEAASYAAQVLLPRGEGLLTACGTPAAPAWISVEALVTRLREAAYSSVYEVYVARLGRWLQHGTAAWPALWREAVAVHCVATFGVDLADEAQLQALEHEAHDALWEAHRALYGSPYDLL